MSRLDISGLQLNLGLVGISVLRGWTVFLVIYTVAAAIGFIGLFRAKS